MYGVRAGTSAWRFQRLGAGGVFVWDSGRTAWVCVHLSVSERADSLYGSAGIFLWRCGVCSFPDFKYRIFYSGNREPAADDGPGKRKMQLAFVDGVLSAIFFLYPLRVRHDARIWTFMSGDGTSGAVCGRGAGKRLLDWRGSSSGGGDPQVEL